MGAQVITTLLVGRDERDKSQTAQNQNIPNVWAACRTISSQEAWGGPFTNKEVLVLFDLRKCGPRLLPTKPSSQAPWLSYRPWVACGGQARGSIFCLGQSRMIASLLIDETESAVVRTWAREVRLTWEICRPSGKTLALHRSWSTGSRGSHLNRKAPANTGGIKKAHKIHPIGGGQQLIAAYIWEAGGGWGMDHPGSPPDSQPSQLLFSWHPSLPSDSSIHKRREALFGWRWSLHHC